MKLKKPDFFIVGAPKCGTTAMNNYLAQHPDVFMAQKEIHYFGADLKMRERVSQSEYLSYFQNAEEKKIIGEASVWYLFSKKAAEEIKAFSPRAKIVIMLRNPVEVLPSLHSQHLFNANEEVRDFEAALALDNERRKGNQLPHSHDFFELPLYLDSVLFGEQVKRYLDIFGPDNVHIILYDDFIKNTRKIVDETIEFLDLKPGADIKYSVVNPNKKIRFFTLHRLLKLPPQELKKIVRIVVPVKKIRHELMALLFKLNIRISKRKKIDEKLRMELRNYFSDDIKKLSSIINRDLSEWLR